MGGSLEPTMKYQRQRRFQGAVVIHLRMPRIHEELQSSQHPNASSGQLVTLENLQHRHPSASLGQT